ncbi:hypothetical protein ACIODS_12485 [Micromonospora chalcea]|uniref:hypothetical protein n=1 Tax=Micromonospora chalcea TaxID=1874 RepID=UPI003816F714
MTDIAVREDNTPAQQAGPRMPAFEAAPSALMQWAMEAREAARIADMLSRTSFVPMSLRGKPADIAAAILAGQELGLQPMATLRSIDVIQGTPGLRAHAMRGLVQSKGHKVQIVESTDKFCRMRGRRADEGDQDWQEIEWTIEQARDLGLLGKDQWKKQPKTMLQARATGVICRLVASDVLHAMPYNSEELSDGNAEPTPFRTTARVDTAEILANAEAAKRAAGQVSGPSAETHHERPDLGEDENAWDDVQVAQPADANGGAS